MDGLEWMMSYLCKLIQSLIYPLKEGKLLMLNRILNQVLRKVNHLKSLMLRYWIIEKNFQKSVREISLFFLSTDEYIQQ